jgi:regulator of protease activity HflC (stomatin/prohibitin superfamily)
MARTKPTAVPNKEPSPSAKPLVGLMRLLSLYGVLLVGALLLRAFCLVQVPAGFVGVRVDSFAGVVEEDLEPGLHLEISGMHRVHILPVAYRLLDYSEGTALTVRTKDNNTVTVDVSVPYHIKPGDAWKMSKEGNHLPDGEGRFRFDRFAQQATDDVLLAELAKLSSEDFYNTDRREDIAEESLRSLNERLGAYHLEADSILIRQVYFRPEYEQQLGQIQLNEQTKLLDIAMSKVSNAQQTLDNYNNQTQAMASARVQDWARRLANLERAYMVGSLQLGDDAAPGAARRNLESLDEAGRSEALAAAVTVLGLGKEQVSDAHLMGIKNIEAETQEYRSRVFAEADGISARLVAEGTAQVAMVQGGYEAELNDVLNTPAGGAYVAFKAAQNIKFAPELVFRSSDGIPSIYRLRDFARAFMGSSR